MIPRNFRIGEQVRVTRKSAFDPILLLDDEVWYGVIVDIERPCGGPCAYVEPESVTIRMHHRWTEMGAEFEPGDEEDSPWREVGGGGPLRAVRIEVISLGQAMEGMAKR